jgi:hypothetical protein
MKELAMRKKSAVAVLSLVIAAVAASAGADGPSPKTRPDGSGWKDVFKPDLSDAIVPDGVWTFKDGILTASEDRCIWTRASYADFILDLEFRNSPGTNSGVIVYCTDVENWIPNSVEIQIADDFAEQWATAPKTWQCGAVFGHLAPVKSAVKKPGEWNRFTVECGKGKIRVTLNGEAVTDMDMALWKSAKTNPDGSEIPSWLSTPLAELKRNGHVGFQGKHAGAPIEFRNLKIREF